MFDLQPTYSEARDWFVWLRVFTPSELADSMAVDVEVAQRFITAGLFWKILQDTGDSMNGTSAGYEPLYEWIPLPTGPRFARTFPPEWKITPGVGELAPAGRGLPVRLYNQDKRRRLGSVTGGGGLREKLREKRYKEMMEARDKAKEAAKRRSEAKPQTSAKRKAEQMKEKKRQQREAKKAMRVELW